MTLDRFTPRPPEDIPAPIDPPDTVFEAMFTIDWGDLDPAQIAYTGRMPDFAVRAIDRFMAACAGGGFFGHNRDYGIDTPFAHLSVDFVAPVTVGELFCAVHIDTIGRTSTTFRILAEQNGTLCFRSRAVLVFVDATVFRAAPIPPNVRATLESYRDRFPIPAEAAA